MKTIQYALYHVMHFNTICMFYVNCTGTLVNSHEMGLWNNLSMTVACDSKIPSIGIVVGGRVVGRVVG